MVKQLAIARTAPLIISGPYQMKQIFVCSEFFLNFHAFQFNDLMIFQSRNSIQVKLSMWMVVHVSEHLLYFFEYIREMNKNLYDSNDGLRSALASEAVAAKRRVGPLFPYLLVTHFLVTSWFTSNKSLQQIVFSGSGVIFQPWHF